MTPTPPVDVTGWSLEASTSPRTGLVRGYLVGTRVHRGVSDRFDSSAIVEIDGDVLHTVSGSTYRLVGPPALGFAQACLVTPIDPAHPLASLHNLPFMLAPRKT